VVTTRSLVRTGPDATRAARWTAILREAAEQSGRGIVPSLLPTLSLTEALATAEGARVMAFEGERRSTLREALADRPPTISLFIGPEGGFAPEEVACATDAGARLVTLGPRTLRAETAAVVLAALALYETESDDLRS
jgi:16S rRNA (uracil1498-N3)-methyltransferase